MHATRTNTSVGPRVDVQGSFGPVLNHVALGKVHAHVRIVCLSVGSRSTEKGEHERRLHETGNLLVVQEGNEDRLLRVELVRRTGRGYVKKAFVPQIKQRRAVVYANLLALVLQDLGHRPFPKNRRQSKHASPETCGSRSSRFPIQRARGCTV